MTRRRALTDEQCQHLATWYTSLRALGNVQQKARELGISVCAVYDAIARGQGRPTAGTRFKLREYRRYGVPRESIDNESIASAELSTEGTP